MPFCALIWAVLLLSCVQACSGREADKGDADADVDGRGPGAMEDELDAGRADAAASDASADARARDAGPRSDWVEPALNVTLCAAGQVACNGACLTTQGQTDKGCTLIALGNISTIAIDGAEVYYAFSRRPEPAGSALEYQVARYSDLDHGYQTLHEGLPVVSLALDADALYFARPAAREPDADGGVVVTTPGSLWRVPRAGGLASKQLDGLSESADCLAVTSGRIFFGNGSFDLASIPIGGGAITTLHTGGDATPWATSLVDGDRLFVEEPGGIRVAPLSNLSMSREIGERGRFSFVADSDSLYVPLGSWTSQLWIERLPKSGGTTQRLANLYGAGERNFPVSLRAAHAGYAYVFRAKPQEPFAVQRSSREDELQTIAVLRTLITIATPRNPPLAVSDDALYVGTPDGLLRVELP